MENTASTAMKEHRGAGGRCDREFSRHHTRILGSALILAWFWVWLSPSTALAHRIYVFAWVEAEQVMVEAYFSKSRKVKNGRIEVSDPSGRLLLEGTTDDKGAFAFRPPLKTDLTITVHASQGHKNHFTISASELASIKSPPAAASSTTGPAPTAVPLEQTAPAKIAPSREAAPVPTDYDELRKIVGEAVETGLENRLGPLLTQSLDERLRPLAGTIARLTAEKGPSEVEIIGGIGWIVGLMGLVMYYRSRKR